MSANKNRPASEPTEDKVTPPHRCFARRTPPQVDPTGGRPFISITTVCASTDSPSPTRPTLAPSSSSHPTTTLEVPGGGKAKKKLGKTKQQGSKPVLWVDLF